MMLSTRSYTRAELIEIYGTDRLDSIKRRITNDGYKYTMAGRGKDFVLTITEQPPRFRTFCIEELGFLPQTDFKKLKRFLYRFFLDEEFMQLPCSEMERRLKEEIGVCRQTIKKWLDKLVAANFISFSLIDFNYYKSTRGKDGLLMCETIEKSQYSKAWEIYWENRDEGYCAAACSMYCYLGGTPHKKEVVNVNAFTLEKIKELQEILKSEV